MLHFVMYVDRTNEWRWQMLAANNRVIGDSGEGYRNRSDCEQMINFIKQNAPTAQILVKAPR